jgi:hypothetical protein
MHKALSNCLPALFSGSMSDNCTLLRRMAGFAADAFDQEKQNTEASAVASDLGTLSQILQASPPISLKLFLARSDAVTMSPSQIPIPLQVLLPDMRDRCHIQALHHDEVYGVI